MALAAVAQMQERGSSDSPAKDAGPIRTCIATRESHPKDRLIRFVIGPDEAVTPDIDGKLPGRGLYVRPERPALERAGKKNLFARAAKRQVSVPPDLADLVERLVARRLVEQIGLARRAGAAVAGFEKVRAALRQGGRFLVLTASDGAADGRSKIESLAHAAGADVRNPLERAELAKAFGRDDAVHAAIEIDAGFTSLLRYADWLDAMRNQADNPLSASGGGAGSAL